MKNVHELVPPSKAAKISCPQGWMLVSKEPATWPLASNSTSSVLVVSSGNGNDAMQASRLEKASQEKEKEKARDQQEKKALRNLMKFWNLLDQKMNLHQENEVHLLKQNLYLCFNKIIILCQI